MSIEDQVEEPRFGPAVEAHHQRIPATEWDRIFIIGDVHGCIDEFRALLSAVEFDDDDLGIVVGDLVRKGPASDEVLALVTSRSNLRSVRGNNEQKIVDGEATVGLTDDDAARLGSMPLAISVGEALVVHGGVDPRKPLVDQRPEDLLEMRSLSPEGGYARPLWFERYASPPRVFFGHTVLTEPYVGRWAVGLDVGCVHGGGLAAFELGAERVHTVESRTYLERSPETIVSTSELIPGR